MNKVLIIDKDRETVASIDRLLQAFHIGSDTALSHPNAIQTYASGNLSAVFLDAEIPTISANSLLAEFESISARAGRQRPMVIFLYKKMTTIQQQRLTKIPSTLCLKKPISLVELYGILERLKLTSIKRGSEELIEEKMSRYADFLESSAAWLKQLKLSLPGP